MLNDLSKKIYEYIKERCLSGFPPTIREICADLKIKSTSTAHKYVALLADEGLIEKGGSSQTRTIRIPDLDMSLVPLVGTITAGTPITAVENVERSLALAGMPKTVNELFALRVRGESMRDIGIMDGDLVVVEKTPVAQNGEIVAAMLDGEATVKRFYKENGGYRLQPENTEMAPIVADRVDILGRVVACLRYY